jgi:hypothetical protein
MIPWPRLSPAVLPLTTPTPMIPATRWLSEAVLPLTMPRAKIPIKVLSMACTPSTMESGAKRGGQLYPDLEPGDRPVAHDGAPRRGV